MGRKRIYKDAAERQRASRERKKRLGITEPTPWIIRGVPEDLREEITEIAENRWGSDAPNATIGHVVTEYLTAALRSQSTNMERLGRLEDTVFNLLLDIRCGRSSATGAVLERQVEDILHELTESLG